MNGVRTRIDRAGRTPSATAWVLPLFMAAGLMAMSCMAMYITIRVALVVEAGYRGSDIMVAVLLLLAEAFVLFHAFGYVVSVIRAMRFRREVPAAVLDLDGELPAVDVIMPARHEKREILEQTLATLAGMSYPNKTVWLLDDSSDEKHQREAAELAEEFGARLFRREERHGAKAGIINDCLAQLNGKYLAVFDADQNPLPFFLNRIVPLLEADPKLAFVQTPQFYSNFDKNRVARGAGSQQAVFYEYICEAKAASGTAFCCGTNVVFRRDALQNVGGLDESSVTEDFATSIKLHMAGWTSFYYGHAYVMGIGPETLPAYFRQQYRWARGTLGVGLKLLGTLFRKPWALSFWQWIDYGLSGSFYLVGWAHLVLMICPILYLMFGIPSYFVRPGVYLAAFLPYILFAIVVFIGGLQQRRYTLGQMIHGQLLALLSMPVHMMASLSALFGIKTQFGVTPKGQSEIVPLHQLWPQIALCVGCFVAFVWGVCRFTFEYDVAAGINALWCGIHFAALSSVMYFRETVPAEATETRTLELCTT